ncbi:hypothetical protein ABT040_39480 [Streptomyces sp. NPDC002688]
MPKSIPTTLPVDGSGFGCSTGSCGGAPLSIVKDYIENQKRPE